MIATIVGEVTSCGQTQYGGYFTIKESFVKRDGTTGVTYVTAFGDTWPASGKRVKATGRVSAKIEKGSDGRDWANLKLNAATFEVVDDLPSGMTEAESSVVPF